MRLTQRRDHPAGDLTYSEQRALEIGMTLATGADVILLDEPTAGMSREELPTCCPAHSEVTEGKTLLIVEHDMNVVFSLCDRVSVLVYGRILQQGRRTKSATTRRCRKPISARRWRNAAQGRGPARALW